MDGMAGFRAAASVVGDYDRALSDEFSERR